MRVIIVSGAALVAEALGALLSTMDGIDVIGIATAEDAERFVETGADYIVLDEMVDPQLLPLDRWLAQHPTLTLIRVTAADRAPIQPVGSNDSLRTRLELDRALRPTAGARELGSPNGREGICERL